MQTEWEIHVRELFPVRLVTGEKKTGPMMRRRDASGRWEYRKMTPDEEAKYMASDAW